MSNEFKVEIDKEASTAGRLVGRITMTPTPAIRKMIEDRVLANDKQIDEFVAANGPIPETIFGLIDGMLQSLDEDYGPIEISISRMVNHWSFQMDLNDGVVIVSGQVRI